VSQQKVVFFRQYPFQAGERIRIEDGPRKGDWEVVSADEKSATLRCPISGRQFTWKRFCYLAGERITDWPQED